MDEMEKRVKMFFNDCKRYSSSTADQQTPSSDTEFKAVKGEYYKILEDADEKVHLANQMYELVDKYLRRLDTELHKFKCELEADNKGITEILEKRSLELDTPATTPNISSQQQKENRYERCVRLAGQAGQLKVSSNSFRYRPRSEKRRDSSNCNVQTSFTEKRPAVAAAAAAAAVPIIETRHMATPQPAPPAQATVSYNLSHIGAGPAIAAAASQAIAATQQVR